MKVFPNDYTSVKVMNFGHNFIDSIDSFFSKNEGDPIFLEIKLKSV